MTVALSCGDDDDDYGDDDDDGSRLNHFIAPTNLV